MSVLSWSMRRAKKRLDASTPRRLDVVIEYVPPDSRGGEAAADGRMSYFWIGDDDGCYATIDALELAAFVDKVRGG